MNQLARTAYQPFPLGQGFCVCPPEQAGTDPERQLLIMDRGAFGSGEHETTRSCVELLERLPLAGPARKILDLGSGTGILSIAALLLGPGHSWCVDIDPTAVESCRRNLQLNQVSDQVTHLCGPLENLAERDFDLILANIYGDILLAVAEDLTSRAGAGAHLLLSGILWEDSFAIKQRYQALGCRLLCSRQLDDFCTHLYQHS